MEITFIGAEKIEGTKQDGTSYGPFYKMHYLTELKCANFPNRRVDAYGHSSGDVTVPEAVYLKLRNIKVFSRLKVDLEALNGDFTKTRISNVTPV
jgi:hypothetical protein